MGFSFSWRAGLSPQQKSHIAAFSLLHRLARCHAQVCSENNTATQVTPHTTPADYSTFELNGKARQAHGGVTSKCQEKTVSAALNSVWGLRALETPNEGTVGVRPFVDVQEVIAGFHVEAAREEEQG